MPEWVPRDIADGCSDGEEAIDDERIYPNRKDGIVQTLIIWAEILIGTWAIDSAVDGGHENIYFIAISLSEK